MDTFQRTKGIVDASLYEVVDRLVAVFNPVRVYLFGSRARGDYRESSDYDLMVITPHKIATVTEIIRKTSQALQGSEIRADVKIWEKSSFQRQLHLKASMPAIVVREGQLLYDIDSSGNGSDEWIPAGLGLVCEKGPGELDQVLVENTRKWLEKARADIRGAEFFISDSGDDLGEALFHCQQAVEKSMKALLTWHDVVPKKIHHLAKLHQDCNVAEPSLSEILNQSDSLTHWSIDGRYVTDCAPATMEEATDGLRLSREVFQAVNDAIPEAARVPLGKKV